MQRLICSACGRGHTFSLPVGEALARAYAYNCPETGKTATMIARGQWEAAEHLSQGAVMLSAIPVVEASPTP
jgi:hypothetical protein